MFTAHKHLPVDKHLQQSAAAVINLITQRKTALIIAGCFIWIYFINLVRQTLLQLLIIISQTQWQWKHGWNCHQTFMFSSLQINHQLVCVSFWLTYIYPSLPAATHPTQYFVLRVWLTLSNQSDLFSAFLSVLCSFVPENTIIINPLTPEL